MTTHCVQLPDGRKWAGELEALGLLLRLLVGCFKPVGTEEGPDNTSGQKGPGREANASLGTH